MNTSAVTLADERELPSVRVKKYTGDSAPGVDMWRLGRVISSPRSEYYGGFSRFIQKEKEKGKLDDYTPPLKESEKVWVAMSENKLRTKEHDDSMDDGSVD